MGVDGKLYFIPGHARRVMVCDPETDPCCMMAPWGQEGAIESSSFSCGLEVSG